MATPLPLPEKILLSSDKTVTFNVINASMGDSYTQSAPRGLNPRIDTWDITWGLETDAQKQTVTDILDAVGEWGLISWTPCGETTMKYFRIKPGTGYKVIRGNTNGSSSISTTLIEQFDVNP